MIQAIQDVRELDKIWRQTILKQSELKSDRVLNSMSVRGVDLVKQYESVTTSIDVKDCFIVFNVKAKESDNDISMEEDSSDLTIYKAYTFSMTIYGEKSEFLGSMLKARIESDKCRTDLFEQGVYFERISSFTTETEFYNETAWRRTDIVIDFSIRLDITQIDDYEDFDHLSDLQVVD